MLLRFIQAYCVSPRFALLKAVGVEVVHVRAERSAHHSIVWSPDGEMIAHIKCSTTADFTSNALLVTCVASGRQLVVAPPCTPVLSSCMFWTPNSALLVFITGTRACFVSRQMRTARMQQTSLPQGLCVHRVMCSRAGLVVVAQLGEQQGIISICSLAGKPSKLRVLQQVSTARAALSLALSPSGLLLAWTDCGTSLSPRPDRSFQVKGRSCVRVCELTTGRCATVHRFTAIADFQWEPVPITRADFADDHLPDSAVILSWATTGSALFICSLLPTGRHAQRLRLLP